MTTEIPTVQKLRYCDRTFTQPGTEAHDRHKGNVARHGHFCDRCFYRTDRAVRQLGNMVEHILRDEVAGIQSKQDDGSQKTKRNPPLPFNVEAFNDANEVYSRLVYWCTLFADRLGRQRPTPAARAWKAHGNRIVGLPNDIDPAQARYVVSIMSTWLSAHLEDICTLPATDDVSYFHDEMTDSYTLAAKWPAEDRAIYAPVHCWIEDCKARIAVYPPLFQGDEQKIRCDSGHVFTEDEYDRMSSVFRQVRKEQANQIIKAHRVAERLARKYSGAA